MTKASAKKAKVKIKAKAKSQVKKAPKSVIKNSVSPDEKNTLALDMYYMNLALKLAKCGKYTTSPNPCVGCVIVRDNKILGCGFHYKAGTPHAEINALRSARSNHYDVEGATCYVTLEPCSHYGRTPPCAQALIDAKIARVVIANRDCNPLVAGRGIKMLEDANIEVTVGVLEDKAYKINRAFFKSIEKRMPYTIAKYGMSLDGKIALSTRESKWITSAKSRSHVQALRLWADAIITSHSTVKADNPRFSVRYNELPKKIRKHISEEAISQPIKVVIDSKGSLLEGGVKALKQYDMFSSGKNYIVVGERNFKLYAAVKEEQASKLKQAQENCQCIDEVNSHCTCDDASEILNYEASLGAFGGSAIKSSGKVVLPTRSRQIIEQDSVSDNEHSNTLSNLDEIAKEQELGNINSSIANVKSTAKNAPASSEVPVVTKAAGDMSKQNIFILPQAFSLDEFHERLNNQNIYDRYYDPKCARDEILYKVEELNEHVCLVTVPLQKGFNGEYLDLKAVLEFLGSLEVRVAMIEAGPTLGSAFISQELVDEVLCYCAPKVLGHDALPAFNFKEPSILKNCLEFEVKKVTHLGSDILWTLVNPH